MLTGEQKTQGNASAFVELLEQYHRDGYEFLSHIVTRDKSWDLFVTVETKEYANQWMHTNSPNKPKNLNKPCRQKSDCNCFLEKAKSAAGEIHETRDHNNVTSVLQKTKKCLGHSEKRRGMLTSGVVLFDDNVLPHTACSHTNTDGPFELGVVSPRSLQP
jgi:hypothetical protein